MHKNLKTAHFVLFITFLCGASCRHQPPQLREIGASHYQIDTTLPSDEVLDTFIKPYRERVNEVLDTPLSFSPVTYTKTDGSLNTSLGNLMADMVLQMTDSLASLKGTPPADVALLNHGGIRGIISVGAVSERTSYELMPFENTIFIQELSGETIAEMVRFLIDASSPHPFSGMRIVLDAEGRIAEVSIQGKPLDQSRTYRVATSSYLVTGGDNMNFFKKAVSGEDTGYKIRNAITDYFKVTDTLRAQVDDRFIQLAKE